MGDRFCFLAIVRDESPVIERCLQSVRNLATSYLICDTGSEDDTIEKIENFLKEANVPGEVIRTEWVSYGETKSYLFEQFRNHPTLNGAEYICWLDADEVFVTRKDDPLSYPTKEDAEQLYQYLKSRSENVFMLTTLYANLNYQRWQIARNDQLYQWRLPYQEYFTGTSYTRTHNIDFLYNLARKEGNSSRDPDITKKRVKMAEAWLSRQTKDRKNHDYARMLFYLAEAYTYMPGDDENGMSYKQKAIEMYRERFECEGYYQEKYIGAIRASTLVPAPEKLGLLLWAVELIPDRLEAIHELMMYYYKKGDHRKAAAIGYLAPENRIPPSDALFVDAEVWNYLFDMNWSVSCHYAGHDETAVRVGEALVSRGTVPEGPNRKIAIDNVGYFRAKLNQK